MTRGSHLRPDPRASGHCKNNGHHEVAFAGSHLVKAPNPGATRLMSGVRQLGSETLPRLPQPSYPCGVREHAWKDLGRGLVLRSKRQPGKVVVERRAKHAGKQASLDRRSPWLPTSKIHPKRFGASSATLPISPDATLQAGPCRPSICENGATGFAAEQRFVFHKRCTVIALQKALKSHFYAHPLICEIYDLVDKCKNRFREDGRIRLA